MYAAPLAAVGLAVRAWAEEAVVTTAAWAGGMLVLAKAQQATSCRAAATKEAAQVVGTWEEAAPVGTAEATAAAVQADK